MRSEGRGEWIRPEAFPLPVIVEILRRPDKKRAGAVGYGLPGSGRTQGNTISLTSPLSEVLTTDGCRLGDETWPFPGPFPAGTTVTFSFFSGFTNSPGKIRVKGGHPTWTVEFEDATDNDFNDIVLRVVADAGSCTMFDDQVTDPLLLDPPIQEILQELAELSNFDEPFPNRLERGGYMVEQPDGTTEFVEHRYMNPDGTPGAQPELCTVPYDPTLQREIQDQGGTILGQIHTHPLHRGTRPNPGTCNRWTPRGDGTYDVQPLTGDRLRIEPGPSDADVDLWERGLAEWPGYMISPERVYRWERDGPFPTGLANEADFELATGDDACIAR